MEDNRYKFDLDANGVLALTAENVDRINFIIDNDSNYRLFSDMDNHKSVCRYVADRKETTPWSVDEILHIVTEIDKQNSTHQDSIGVKKDASNSTSKNNESDGGGRYTFSFASKFCTYVSQALYNSDEYSIYDKVVSDILPYYAWSYLEKDCYFGRTKSKISKVFGLDDKNGDYESYRKLIDAI